MQKTAYRRANGGSGAPGVFDDVAPKFLTFTSLSIKERMEQAWPKLVVRKTFLDLEDWIMRSHGTAQTDVQGCAKGFLDDAKCV